MTDNTRWIVYALLGAVFAALVQITSKKAFNVTKIDSATVNLIRVAVAMAFFSVVIGYETWIEKSRQLVGVIDRPMKVAVGWVVASGIAGALSWHYGYKALKLADVSQTYPLDKLSVALGVILAVIFLHERPSGWNWIGIGLMVLGAYCVMVPHGQSLNWLWSGKAK